MKNSIILLTLFSFLFVQCAGRFAMTESGKPHLSFASSMDQTHDENFKMPPDEKENLADKTGMIIVAAVAVAVAVASAVAIPILLSKK